MRASRAVQLVLPWMTLAALTPSFTNPAAAERNEPPSLSGSLSGSYLAGRFARSLNDVSGAASFYGTALTLDPGSDMLIEQAFVMEASRGAWPEALRLAQDLIAIDPDHRMARLCLGIAAFKSAQWVQAEEHFKRASTGPIGELTGALAMAWVKLAQDQPTAALSQLVVPKQAEWAQFYLRYHRALVADAAGRTAEARSSFQRVFKQDGRTLRTALAYARSLAHAGDIRTARAILKEHLESSQGDGHPLARALLRELQLGSQLPLLVATPGEGLSEVFYGLGESLIGEGAVGVGILYLQLALFVTPEHPFALAALANAYETNRLYAEAIEVYDRIPKGSPLEPAIEIRKAFNLNSLDRVDEARATLKRLIDGDPAVAASSSEQTTDYQRPVPDLGGQTLQIGSKGDVVRDLQGALAELGYDIGGAVDGVFGEATRRAVIQFQTATRLTADGIVSQETIQAIVERANANGPQPLATLSGPGLDPSERLQALDALGNILRSRKLYAEAIEVYDRAIEMIKKPERRHWVYFYARGTSYERMKNWPPAERDLKKALELYPDQPLTLNYLGYSWIDQGVNLDQGMTLIERAVALKPDDGYIVDSLGWAHYKRGNYKEAVRYLERAVELRPDDPVLNDHLGDALWRVGREREARFQWEQSLTLNPEPEDEAKTRQKLREGLLALEKETRAAVNESASGPTAVETAPSP